MINTITKKQPGQGRVYFSVPLRTVMKRSHGRNVEAGADAEATEGDSAYWLAPWLPFSLLSQLRTRGASAHCTLGPPTWIIHQGNAHACPQADLVEALFLNRSSSSQMTLACVKLTKNLTSTSAQKHLFLPWVTVGGRETPEAWEG